MKIKNLKLVIFNLVIFLLAFLTNNIVFAAISTGDMWTWNINTWETSTGIIETTDTTLPQIMIDEETNTIYVTGWNINTTVDTWSTIDMTGTIKTWNTEEEIVEMPEAVILTPEQEFEAAISWMHTNWLTMYDSTWDYRWEDLLTREEASKIIWQAYFVLWYSDVTKNASCTFSDSETFNPTLAPHIANVCKWWLFKWSDGKFMAQDTLTKAQSMAVLMRMFEWKMSYELQNPRREQYYTKWKLIWLTTVDDINKFDHELTRYEIALMIYRLKNLVQNEQLKSMALNKIWNITTNQEDTIASWTINPETVTDNLETLVWWINPNTDPELLEAIYWMHDNNLTIYNNPTEYKPFDTLNRAGAAKIFDKFSNMLSLWTSEAYLPGDCEFTDIANLDSTTQAHIVNICKKWLIKWWNWLFKPNDTINKSQFIVALIRMFEWKHLDETTDPRWNNYFVEAQELWLVAPWDALTFDTPISRYEVALFLYKFNIKYKMLNNLNNNRLMNEIISTVEWSIWTWTNGKLKANVYVDTNLLKDGWFDVWYVEIFGTRYKIVKDSEESYFTDNFVRYWKIFDMVTDTEIWTINFIVSNGYVIETTIRMTNWDWKNYKVSWIKGTNAYYQINEL